MRTVLDDLTQDEQTVRKQLARAANDYNLLESLLELIQRNKACRDLKRDDPTVPEAAQPQGAGK